ncbi:MAG: methyltransferase domain-containing protein [Acidimicrobiales bacterium]
MRGRTDRWKSTGDPLEDSSIDLVWLSTVVHHLTGLDQCVNELARVTKADAPVLIRDLFSDRGSPKGVMTIPGWRRAVSAFPSSEAIEKAMLRGGFKLVDCLEVEERNPVTVGEAAERIRRLRHADSILIQISDDEINEGLDALDQRDPDEQLAPSMLALLAFSKGR